MATVGRRDIIGCAALHGVRVGAGHIGDQQLADREPFLDIGEVVGDGGRNIPFDQQAEQPQAGIVVVVPAHRTGRSSSGSNKAGDLRKWRANKETCRR